MSDIDDQIARAVDVLRRGGLVAFPTETVYGLGADASNADAVHRVFAVKGRPAAHPVIVHLAHAAQLDEWSAPVPPAAPATAPAVAPSAVVSVPAPAPAAASESSSAPVVPAAPATAPSTAAPLATTVVFPAAETPKPAETAPIQVEPAPAQPAAPAVVRKLEPRAINFINSIRVAGIRASATDSKVLMMDRVYRIGDTVGSACRVAVELDAVDGKIEDGVEGERGRGAEHRPDDDHRRDEWSRH